VILWVSGMPELDEQTQRKVESKPDRFYRAHQLIPIDHRPRFRPSALRSASCPEFWGAGRSASVSAPRPAPPASAGTAQDTGRHFSPN
jgi:hypothetical protein